MTPQQRVTAAFHHHFGTPPEVVVRAPGRVNLIGEHTDYNDGYVLPMAIDRAVWVALRPRADRRVLLHSLDFDDVLDLPLAGFERGAPGWREYVKGVAWALREAGYDVRGWEGVMAGDVPIGAGLASSAALELAAARAFAAASGFGWDAVTMAKLAQRAENQWIGMKSGIMDQMIAAAGRAGYALLLDCRSLATEPVPLPSGAAVVVLDTATRRELVTSSYNERRAQCEAAAAFFGAPALRDVTAGQFVARAGELDPLTYRRARHVISENARVLQAVAALRAGAATAMGRLMNASHDSLRDDFEVSSAALDTMVALARDEGGCYGARMTGAGFGGCAVALVESEAAAHFMQAMAANYARATGLTPAVYLCEAADGAAVV